MMPDGRTILIAPQEGCHRYCMAPFGSHHERCQMPTDHDGGRLGCNHAGGICSELPSKLGTR